VSAAGVVVLGGSTTPASRSDMLPTERERRRCASPGASSVLPAPRSVALAPAGAGDLVRLRGGTPAVLFNAPAADGGVAAFDDASLVAPRFAKNRRKADGAPLPAPAVACLPLVGGETARCIERDSASISVYRPRTNRACGSRSIDNTEWYARSKILSGSAVVAVVVVVAPVVVVVAPAALFGESSAFMLACTACCSTCDRLSSHGVKYLLYNRVAVSSGVAPEATPNAVAAPPLASNEAAS